MFVLFCFVLPLLAGAVFLCIFHKSEKPFQKNGYFLHFSEKK